MKIIHIHGDIIISNLQYICFAAASGLRTSSNSCTCGAPNSCWYCLFTGDFACTCLADTRDVGRWGLSTAHTGQPDTSDTDRWDLLRAVKVRGSQCTYWHLRSRGIGSREPCLRWHGGWSCQWRSWGIGSREHWPRWHGGWSCQLRSWGIGSREPLPKWVGGWSCHWRGRGIGWCEQWPRWHGGRSCQREGWLWKCSWCW